MKNRKVIILTEKWNPGAHDAPTLRELENNLYGPPPFPLSLDAQKQLLELIYTRRSGIISRQELLDIIFAAEPTDKIN
jgi:hypothetical protein